MKISNWITGSVLTLSLAAGAAFADEVCVGQKVFGDNGNKLVGIVTHLFGNKAEVSWQTMNGASYSGSPSFWGTESLSTEIQCRGAICKGMVVHGSNGNHLVGTVNTIFTNGTAEMSWSLLGGASYSGDFSYWDTASLSKEVSCSGAVCQNAQVLGENGNYLVGTVVRVFEDGTAEVRWFQMNGQPYSGDLSYWQARSLQPSTAGCSYRPCR